MSVKPDTSSTDPGVTTPPTDEQQTVTGKRAICGLVGSTFGVEPNAETVTCELPAGHRTKHWGHTSMWTSTWGLSSQPDPYGNFAATR